MPSKRYLVTVKIISTEKIKVYRIYTTLAGIEWWFLERFKDGEAEIIKAELDKNQD